jgi:hypothetical protein
MKVEHAGMADFGGDRETLRALADDGNEKALDWLTLVMSAAMWTG